MRRILDGLYLIQNKMGANVYLIENQDGFDLIDSGIFKETPKVIEQIEAQGFDMRKLKKIILTHCHCDHIGGAADLARDTAAEIAAHRDDIPYILQEKLISGPYHDMMRQEHRFMKKFNCVIQNVDIPLSDHDVLDLLGGLQVISVPGHTPGSIALYQPERKIMFFGDVIRNKEKRGLVIGIPEKFNYDTEQTIKDARKLLDYPINYALFGHGEPILENAKDLLLPLLERF